MLLGEETSGNHQAYRRGHLDIILKRMKSVERTISFVNLTSWSI